MTLKQVEVLPEWLEGKRQAKQSCRVVGESITGKTIACNSYRLRHKPIQEVGKPHCKARFQIPAMWIDGWCHRCFLPFSEMKKYQKSIK